MSAGAGKMLHWPVAVALLRPPLGMAPSHSEPVGSNGGHGVALAIDKTGAPHLCFEDHPTKKLMYVTRPGAIWATEEIDAASASIQGCGIAVDSSNNPHVVYYSQGAGITAAVTKYATRVGGAWSKETFGDGGFTNDMYEKATIVIDSQGTPTVVYAAADSASCTLRLARRIETGWENHPFADFCGSYSACSLALDPSEIPYVAYSLGNGVIVAR